MIVPKIKPVTIGTFISKLFEARTQAHIYHLQTSSYAMHKALNEFYDEILDLTDTLTESYQGKYGIVKGYETNRFVEDSNCLAYLDVLRKFISGNRYIVMGKEDTELQNIIDEIVDLINTTIYKLKFLK